MFKSFVLVICIILFSFVNNAQSRFSIEVGGGIISPINSQNGLIGLVKFLYNYSDDFNLFTNVGYGFWDKNHIGFNYETYSTQKENDEDEHLLIPIYVGGRYYFNRNKIINGFLETELGINILQYNKYEIIIFKIPEKNVTIITQDYNSKKVNSKISLGLGIGLGLVHLLSDGVSLNLGIKLSVLNNYNNYSPIKGLLVFKTLYAGFNCNI
jgi:hypothetical protein